MNGEQIPNAKLAGRPFTRPINTRIAGGMKRRVRLVSRSTRGAFEKAGGQRSRSERKRRSKRAANKRDESRNITEDNPPRGRISRSLHLGRAFAKLR